MRLALLSDIHGNLVALENVLVDLGQAQPDVVVCLGDVAVTGPQPQQTIARLCELSWPTVMGNTDAWLFDPQPWKTSNEDQQRLLTIEQWGAAQIEAEDLDYIRSFQPTIEWDLPAGQSLLCYHGSPRSNTDRIEARTTEEDLIKRLAGRRATILAGGHTHRQMLRNFDGCLLINPGSVGLPLRIISGQMHNPLWAEYALVTYRGTDLKVEFRRVSIDFAKLSTAVEHSNMPHGDWWLKDWH